MNLVVEKVCTRLLHKISFQLWFKFGATRMRCLVNEMAKLQFELCLGKSVAGSRCDLENALQNSVRFVNENSVRAVNYFLRIRCIMLLIRQVLWEFKNSSQKLDQIGEFMTGTLWSSDNLTENHLLKFCRDTSLCFEERCRRNSVRSHNVHDRNLILFWNYFIRIWRYYANES